MQPTSIGRPLALLSAFTSLLLFPSAPGKTGDALGTAQVCAEGTCCPDEISTCNNGGGTKVGYYFKSEGSCKDG